MFNWMLGQLRKSCRKIVSWEKVVCSWKSSELESIESYEKAPRPQPNSVFAQFSVVCMFNWMLGQLRKGCGKVVYSWKSSELESAEPCEENKKNLALNLIQCSRNSQSCVCSIGYSANWERAVGRSFLEGRSYIRGRAPNLNRLNNIRKNAINPYL